MSHKTIELLMAAVTPCKHRSDVPCAACEMIRRQRIIAETLMEPRRGRQ